VKYVNPNIIKLHTAKETSWVLLLVLLLLLGKKADVLVGAMVTMGGPAKRYKFVPLVVSRESKPGCVCVCMYVCLFVLS
jgi:hypothetical protein